MLDLVYSVSSTIVFLILFAIWSTKGGRNMFAKTVLLFVSVIGVINTLTKFGFAFVG